MRTARKPVVLVGPATLDALGATVGDVVTLTGPLGSVDLPVGVGDLAEGTVWAPASAPGPPCDTSSALPAARSRSPTIVGGER